MIPFDEEFEHLQARMLFGMNKFQITWELGKPMPPDLPDRIVEAMQSQGRISIAPAAPAVRLAPFVLERTFSGFCMRRRRSHQQWRAMAAWAVA